MAVHLTRIYTKTGDDGTTALVDGSRTPKSDQRLAAFGDCDEANSALGVAIALGGLPVDVREFLLRVQNDLFDVGADLATPVIANPRTIPLRILESDIARIEQAIDYYNALLPELASFVLPGGSPGAALLHVVRTIVRRAERQTWLALEPARPVDEPAARALPEPVVRPALRPRAVRQYNGRRRGRRRAMEAGR